MARRPALPKDTKERLLYDCAYACVVCQSRAAHIHHIDQDNTNNSSENLAPLCQTHHDEAHTKHQLSQNLTESRLKDFKLKWCREVEDRREEAVNLSAQVSSVDSFLSVGVAWGYINHKRISQMLTSEILLSIDPRLLARCQAAGMVDNLGLIVPPSSQHTPRNYLSGTIYDLFNHLDSMALHRLYSDFVDRVAQFSPPVHLSDDNWTKTFVRTMLAPGQLIFYIKGHYFKILETTVENARIKVRTFRAKIEVEFEVDTRNMFGTTSITTSFTGHQSCSALLQIKSINENGSSLTLNCTPIALGVGFQSQSFVRN